MALTERPGRTETSEWKRNRTDPRERGATCRKSTRHHEQTGVLRKTNDRASPGVRTPEGITRGRRTKPGICDGIGKRRALNEKEN